MILHLKMIYKNIYNHTNITFVIYNIATFK